MSQHLMREEAQTKEQKEKKKLEEEQKKEEEDFVKQLEIISYKIRKTPELYVKEVTDYYAEFKKSFEKVKENPLQKNKKFADLAVFLARIAQFYKFDVLDTYIMEFLEHYANQMNPTLRRALGAALMIMRSKNLLKPVETISFLLRLLNCQDKELRKMIASHVVNDIRRMNKHHKNQKINKSIQNIILEILKNNSDGIAKRSLQIMITLYKKGVWTDEKTVNIIATGCMNENYKIKLISCYFLISTTELEEFESSGSEEEEVDLREKKGINKKTRAKQAKAEREKKKAAKKLRKKMQQNIRNNFFPIDQLYNPQDFAEKVFALLRKSHEKFPVKMCMMSLLSRMIGRHHLMLLNFYSFLQKYLLPHQKDVTKILSYLAESIHKLVPPEELENTLKHVVENFVNDRCSEQAMTWGLNTIREMCVKNYHIMDAFHLNYLAGYYNYKNKYVSRGAKSIINLYRQINPKLLEKKFRGRIRQDSKLKDDDGELLKFGEEYIYDSIEGAELLMEDTNVPVYMDRILTDEDFKKIKFLKMKKAQQEEAERLEQIERMKRGRLADGEDDDDEDDDDDESEEYEDVLSGEWDDEADEYEHSEDEEDEKQKKIKQAQQKKKSQKQPDGSKKTEEGGDDIDIEEDYEDVSDISEDYEDEDEEGDEEDDDEEEIEIEEEDDDDEEEDQSGEEDDDEEEEEGDDDEEEEEDAPLRKKATKKEQKPEKPAKIVLGDNAEDKAKAEELAKSRAMKKANKKRRVDLEEMYDGYSSFDEEEYDEENQGYGNVHGFINPSQIMTFKENRAEARKKLEEENKNKQKEKWYQGPKQKGGGLSNRDKQHFKSLQMLRPKKNKEGLLVKKTKLKIRQIKNQLGHFQSGKHKKTGKKVIKRS